MIFRWALVTNGYCPSVDAVDELGNWFARGPAVRDPLPDSSGAAPPYEYVLYDWPGHRPLGSLPPQNASFELALGGVGSLTAGIPLLDEDYTVGRVEAATYSRRFIPSRGRVRARWRTRKSTGSSTEIRSWLISSNQPTGGALPRTTHGPR